MPKCGHKSNYVGHVRRQSRSYCLPALPLDLKNMRPVTPFASTLLLFLNQTARLLKRSTQEAHRKPQKAQKALMIELQSFKHLVPFVAFYVPFVY